MPTLLDYPGVSWSWHLPPAIPYWSPNLPDKENLLLTFSVL